MRVKTIEERLDIDLADLAVRLYRSSYPGATEDDPPVQRLTASVPIRVGGRARKVTGRVGAHLTPEELQTYRSLTLKVVSGLLAADGFTEE